MSAAYAGGGAKKMGMAGPAKRLLHGPEPVEDGARHHPAEDAKPDPDVSKGTASRVSCCARGIVDHRTATEETASRTGNPEPIRQLRLVALAMPGRPLTIIAIRQSADRDHRLQ